MARNEWRNRDRYGRSNKPAEQKWWIRNLPYIFIGIVSIVLMSTIVIIAITWMSKVTNGLPKVP